MNRGPNRNFSFKQFKSLYPLGSKERQSPDQRCNCALSFIIIGLPGQRRRDAMTPPNFGVHVVVWLLAAFLAAPAIFAHETYTYVWVTTGDTASVQGVVRVFCCASDFFLCTLSFRRTPLSSTFLHRVYPISHPVSRYSLRLRLSSQSSSLLRSHSLLLHQLILYSAHANVILPCSFTTSSVSHLTMKCNLCSSTLPVYTIPPMTSLQTPHSEAWSGRHRSRPFPPAKKTNSYRLGHIGMSM